jgi:hypothetical protein
MVSDYRFVSDHLGMPQFPFGSNPTILAPGGPAGTHIMGVVVIGWLTRFPMQRWGSDWMTSGAISARFRTHLTTGLDLTVAVEDHDDMMSFRIVGTDGELVATGAAIEPRSFAVRPVAAEEPHDGMLADPSPAGLSDRVLKPIEFPFDDERDLAFTTRTADGEQWRRRAWAHPAWIASGSNALLLRNVAFADPHDWRHAGMEVQMFAPVPSPSTVRLSGRVGSLFESTRNRFAVAEIDATVGGQLVASLRNTFAYAPVPSDGSPAAQSLSAAASGRPLGSRSS